MIKQMLALFAVTAACSACPMDGAVLCEDLHATEIEAETFTCQEQARESEDFARFDDCPETARQHLCSE
jgi:hypothetical protein